jgi:magnesium chelatase family protein
VNAEMGSSDVKKYCVLADPARDLLKQASLKLQISARSYFKIVKIAQTIADLSGSATIESAHISEALQYRPKIE